MSTLLPHPGAPTLFIVDLHCWMQGRIDFNGPDGIHSVTGVSLGPCHLWLLSRQGHGYGQASIRGQRGVSVHKFVYEALRGPVPPGLELDHLCRVRHCCNPDHLEPVTRAVNFRRGLRAGALGAINAAKTHCAHGHEYTAENTYVRRTGQRRRECRTCWARRASRAAA